MTAQQHQPKEKAAFLYLGAIQSLILFLALLLGGCPLDDSDDDAESTDDDSDNISLVFNIVDEEGLALTAATADISGHDIAEQRYDSSSRLIVKLPPSENSAVVRISKTGYETGLVYLPNILSTASHKVMLKQRLSPIQVDGLTGGQFSGVNGAQVVIAGESLERPDGTTASGEISLYINTVDTTDDAELAAFPGSFEGLASGDTAPGMLASLGVTSFRFEQNGEKLQLKSGEVSQLTLPLYADTYEDGAPIPLGDLIPMWRLNEETGMWEEESTGIVVEMPSSPTGLGLQASTAHFSSFNADVWGSMGLSGGQGGPAGQSRTMPQVCRVSVQVPEFSEGTYYNAGAAQNLGALASTRTMSGIYYEPFTFPVFQGRPSALRLTEPHYNDREGRTTVESFTCNSDTLALTVLFDAVPAFVGIEALAKPVFEIVDGSQEITSNLLSLRAIFINDADGFAQFSTDMGLNGQLSSDQKVNFSYLPTDPSTVSIAFYLENDLGEADTQTTVDYIASQTPSVRSAYLYKYNGNTTLSWSGVEGADTASIYQFDTDSNSLGVVIESDIDATESDKMTELAYDLPEGSYMVIFQNQYGTTEVIVILGSVTDECLPESDLPCAA